MNSVKKSLLSIGLATSFVGASFFATAPAIAGDATSPASPAAQPMSLSQVHPSIMEGSASLSKLKSIQNGLQIVGEAGTLTIPSTVDGTVSIKSEYKDELKIGLPHATSPSWGSRNGETSISYQNGNGIRTDVVPKEDGSVQIVTTIENVNAPTSFDYEIAVKDFEKIEILDDGTAIFLSNAGEFLGGAQKPWAVDADGTPVPTHYVIDNSVLTQVVDHTAKNVDYPVYADPWLGSNLYSNVYSSGSWVANATPSFWGNGYMNNIAIAWAHRDEIRTRSGLSSIWNDSMSEQTYCHVMGWPVSLPEFNIESWRRHVPWEASLISYQCNP